VRLDDLAKRLSDRGRIGLTPELGDKLKLKSEDATRANLMAMEDEAQGFLGIYLLGAYVVDDTDVWGDGEIYWYSIPVHLDRKGRATWDPILGLPTGMAPHRVGSLEWMQNISLADPPLLSMIPPDDELAACVMRLAFYDDDGEAANLPAAMSAGLGVLAGCSREPLSGADQIIMPVRDAIYKSLKAEDDDILVDQDITLRRGERTRFGAGLIGSEMNAMVRLYYFVRDERRTEQVGPFTMHKGQVETLKFQTKLESGGRLAIFSRGADVSITAFGTLSTDTPFVNRVIESHSLAGISSNGINLNGTGPAKVVAFYTPP
jgi:hypothetical protein